MKTFARVVRRYVLATAAIILLLMALGVAALIGLGYYYGTMRADSFRFRGGEAFHALRRILPSRAAAVRAVRV